MYYSDLESVRKHTFGDVYVDIIDETRFGYGGVSMWNGVTWCAIDELNDHIWDDWIKESDAAIARETDNIILTDLIEIRAKKQLVEDYDRAMKGLSNG